VSKKKRRHAGTAGNAIDRLDSVLAELWATIAAGDLLAAEILTAAILSLPFVTEATRDEIDGFAAAIVTAAARRQPPSHTAAFYRLLMSLGSPAVKRPASRALGELTSEGVYPPEWVTDIGKPVPGQAWRRYDIFGDGEFIAVTFSYGEAEHATLVEVDTTMLPVAGMVGVSEDANRLIKTMRDHDDPFGRWEQISLAEARRRVEAPLALTSQGPVRDLGLSSASFLPLVRSRVRRLPADDAAGAAGAAGAAAFTAADRAAAVEEFLRSPHAAEAGEPDIARFWAEVLTGYSSRVPYEPPAQVGPRKLVAMLVAHVANTFTLSAAQRAGLRPAMTAWTQWATERQGLDEAATAHLMASLPEAFGAFESAYDDPDNVMARRYMRDLAASDADVAALATSLTRRAFAVPFPGDRDPDGGAAFLDATDPDHRAVLAASEFVSCQPDGETRKQFVPAAQRVIEELWRGDPPGTWETARRLLAEGYSRHDIIHALAER
jgi:hypothetical protein